MLCGRVGSREPGCKGELNPELKSGVQCGAGLQLTSPKGDFTVAEARLPKGVGNGVLLVVQKAKPGGRLKKGQVPNQHPNRGKPAGI